MSDSKVFMFPDLDNNNGLMALVGSMLQQKGVDPNVLLAMKNNNGCGEGGWFMWIIFLFFLMGWGGNGYGFNHGNNGGVSPAAMDLSNMMNNDTGRQLLMSAIQGNGDAIKALSSNINCSINSVQQAVNGVMASISNVSNQVGMTSQQVINSIQAGNCQIASRIADMCSDNRLAICQQTNAILGSINNLQNAQQNGFSTVAYETQRQTCELQNSIKDLGTQVSNQFAALETRSLQDKIASLQETKTALLNQISNSNQTQQFAAMIAPMLKEINEIRCAQPSTVTVPQNNGVLVPPCVAWNAGFNNWGGGSIWS